MPTKLNFSRAAASRLLPTVFLCGFSYCGARAADAPSPAVDEPTYQVVAATRRIDIRDSNSLLLEYPDWLTTVKSLDPSVIRVSAVRPNCLRIQRIGAGSATLQAVDRGDQRYSLTVIVPEPSAGR